MAKKNISPNGVEPVDTHRTLDVRTRRIHQVSGYVTAGNYAQAAQLLQACGYDPKLQNVKGVCLLRSGGIDEALQLYRKLVLQPGCTWMRREIPLAYKLNFATALLLAGHPAGCLEILNELGGCEHETGGRLRAAIRAWERSLGFWRRWDWRIGRVEPKGCAVPIDFLPGEFAPGDLPAETLMNTAAVSTPPYRATG